MSDHEGVNSSMLASMKSHGDGASSHSSNHPVTQANNVDTAWNKPVFENNIELFPGAKTANLDLGGVSGSLDHHGIFALLSQDSAFNQDIAGAFDGTIMSHGGVGHEGLDLKLSGDVSAAHSGVASQLNMGEGIHIASKGGGGGQIQ